jgi:hypothetical protein
VVCLTKVCSRAKNQPGLEWHRNILTLTPADSGEDWTQLHKRLGLLGGTFGGLIVLSCNLLTNYRTPKDKSLTCFILVVPEVQKSPYASCRTVHPCCLMSVCQSGSSRNRLQSSIPRTHAILTLPSITSCHPRRQNPRLVQCNILRRRPFSSCTSYSPTRTPISP